VQNAFGDERAPEKPRTYILIHGAWHGGWVWKGIAASLRALGHLVYAPSLTGLGDRCHLLRPGINLDTHTDDIVNLVTMEDLDDVILVGWSYGGMVVSNVVARIPEKIASLVYLDAFLPEPGRALLHYSTYANLLEEAIQDAMAGRDLPPISLEKMGVTDQAVIDFVTPKLTPQPVMAMVQASKALAEPPAVPLIYVFAGRNLSPTFKQFLLKCEQNEKAITHVMDTSHVMMLTDPAGTLDILAHVPLRPHRHSANTSNVALDATLAGSRSTPA
jgi:pimeloyl-ACP methyl ester carboxylesterase